VDHPLEGSWAKLRWAKVNLDALQREFDTFFGDETDPDSLRGYLHIKMPDKLLKSRLEPPWHWPLLVGDIVQAFRASLDYLAWELARLNLKRLGKSREPKRQTAFPLVSNPAKWSFKSPKLVDIGEDERRRIEKFQPYKCDPPISKPTENVPLDWLRILSNRDKHQTLNLVLVRAGLVEQSLQQGEPGWALIASPDLKDARIISAEGEPKSEHKMKTTFHVELEGVSRIDWILDGIGPKVTEIVSAFEPVFEDA
jgi:hypothetical protein